MTYEDDDTTGRHLGRLLAAIRDDGLRSLEHEGEIPKKPDAGSVIRQPPSMPPVGTMVKDTWELTEFIGQGGFGYVFGALQRTLMRRDAIKFLHPHMVGDAEMRQRLRREAMVMAKLRGDHLVHVYDYGEHNGLPFLAMERLEGKSLRDWLAQHGPLPLPKAHRFAAGLLHGLAEVHAGGIIHRDIKPANIFVIRETERIKLLDFGLAMTSMRLTSRGSVMGTPFYMAPELLLIPDSEASVATDIYATGVVIYEMLTGRLPVEPKANGDIGELVRQIMVSTPKPPSACRRNLPAGLDELILRAIDRVPERRPATAEAFLEDLGQCFSVSPGHIEVTPDNIGQGPAQNSFSHCSATPFAEAESDLISSKGKTAKAISESQIPASCSSNPAQYPWPVLVSMAGMMIFWGWGLHGATPFLPWYWTPLCIGGLVAGVVAMMVSRTQANRSWTLDRIDEFRCFLQKANAGAIIERSSKMLDHFYGRNIISWKALRRSALISVGGCVMLLVSLALLLGGAVIDTEFQNVWMTYTPLVGAAWLALNVTSDFCSAVCTRALFRATNETHGAKCIIIVMILDTIALVVFALVPTGLAGSAIIFMLDLHDIAIYRIIWLDYMFGSLVGTGGEPYVIQ